MIKWIIRGLSVAAVLAIAAGVAGFSYVTRDFNYGPPTDRSAWLEQSPSVNAGQLAYIQRDVAGARDIWLAVAEDTSNRAEDRAEAARLLSRISWRIYLNTDDAVTFALAAEQADPGAWENAVATSDANRAAGNWDAAAAAAHDAINRADNPGGRADAADALARVALARVEGKRIDQLNASDRQVLTQAQDALAPLFAQPPARLETSALALAIATRLDDGPAMLAAWGSYYHSPTGVSAMSDQSGAANILSQALPRWTPGHLSNDDRRAIARGLAQSFFFEEAALLLTDQNADEDFSADAEFAQIITMANFVQALATHVNAYYRNVAAANSNSDLVATLQTFQYRQGRKALSHTLWDELALTGEYDEPTLGRTVGQRFGLYWNEGPTSGVYDLHAGFTVLDTTYTADQYGRSADLRYVVVGRMISNGYESWLWDGRQQHGGWATNDTIYQVRPAYADDPLRRWSEVTDPAQRSEVQEDITRLTEEDAEILGDRRVAFLPGLYERLRWQGINALLDEARATDGDAGARQTFILEMGEAVRSYSIFAHEGRHALDKQYAEDWVRNDAVELEFRAKISQVVFSDWPRLTFGAILNPNLGDGTPHGEANARLMTGVVDWMERHAGEIEGINPNAPLLPQFDLLTDDQMREAFRSQDPWSQEAAGS